MIILPGETRKICPLSSVPPITSKWRYSSNKRAALVLGVARLILQAFAINWMCQAEFPNV